MRHPLDPDHADPAIRRLERAGLRQLARRDRRSPWLLLLSLLF
jgi:hypothetical protein